MIIPGFRNLRLCGGVKGEETDCVRVWALFDSTGRARNTLLLKGLCFRVGRFVGTAMPVHDWG